MKRLATLLLALGTTGAAHAQIFAPEGLNMPGSYDSFANPPNAVEIAGVQRVGGQFLPDASVGLPTYKSGVILAGTTLAAGTNPWLFTSGPTTNYFQNKWGGVAVAFNTVQGYTKEGANNSVTLTAGRYYVVRWQDSGYANTNAIWFELTAAPVTVTSVTDDSATRLPAAPVAVTATISAPVSSETVYIRYTTDGFATSTVGAASCAGTSCTFSIPAAAAEDPGNDDFYYVFTSTAAPAAGGSDADIKTLNNNTNGGANYTLSPSTLPVELSAFTAAADGHAAVLRWTTESETNNTGFSVETRRGTAWAEVAFAAGRGTTSERTPYEQRIDGLSAGRHTFRLVQRDLDGTATVSGSVEVAIAPEGDVAVSQVRSSGRVVLGVTPREAQTLRIEAFDVTGRRVATLFEGAADGTTEVTLDRARFAAGVYIVRITGERFTAARSVVVR